MATNATVPAAPGSQIAIVSQRRRAWRTFSRNRSALVGLVLVVVIILVALFAPVLAPHDPATSIPSGVTGSGVMSSHASSTARGSHCWSACSRCCSAA
jgi:ABC-type dipeptide/oligopeptide/nickel transport system permease subunit